jgi:hypothetical protein
LASFLQVVAELSILTMSLKTISIVFVALTIATIAMFMRGRQKAA